MALKIPPKASINFQNNLQVSGQAGPAPDPYPTLTSVVGFLKDSLFRLEEAVTQVESVFVPVCIHTNPVQAEVKSGVVDNATTEVIDYIQNLHAQAELLRARLVDLAERARI